MVSSKGTTNAEDGDDQFQGFFADFKTHFRGGRVGTELTISQSLRQHYPRHHLTCVSADGCDLLGFAADGHAQASRTLAAEYSDTTRMYKAPPGREETGTIKDEVRLSRYNYVYSEVEFTIYQVGYSTDCDFVKLFFVLAPRNQGTITDGEHSKTNELIIKAGSWTLLLHEEVFVFDEGYWKKDAQLWKSMLTASWDDVILDARMKQNLIADVEGFFDSQSLYDEYNVPWKRGIIIWGVPGNGKTVSIKALMHSLARRQPKSIPTLYVKSFDCNRGSQFSIRQIFTHARALAPCLLVFEDLDSLLVPKVRSYFLNEVDGLESNNGILMLGSTNHLARLDPAIAKRPSRFDRKYHFGLPTAHERAAYAAYWQRKLAARCASASAAPLAFPDALCPLVAQMTVGFSFAYMKELFITALLALARGVAAPTPLPPAAASADAGSAAGSTAPAIDTTHAHTTTATATAATTTTNNVAPAAPPHKTLPRVYIPPELRDNVLLRILTQQAAALLAEMDDSLDGDGSGASAEAGTSAGPAAHGKGGGKKGKKAG